MWGSAEGRQGLARSLAHEGDCSLTAVWACAPLSLPHAKVLPWHLFQVLLQDSWNTNSETLLRKSSLLLLSVIIRAFANIIIRAFANIKKKNFFIKKKIRNLNTFTRKGWNIASAIKVCKGSWQKISNTINASESTKLI